VRVSPRRVWVGVGVWRRPRLQRVWSTPSARLRASIGHRLHPLRQLRSERRRTLALRRPRPFSIIIIIFVFVRFGGCGGSSCGRRQPFHVPRIVLPHLHPPRLHLRLNATGKDEQQLHEIVGNPTRLDTIAREQDYR